MDKVNEELSVEIERIKKIEETHHMLKIQQLEQELQRLKRDKIYLEWKAAKSNVYRLESIKRNNLETMVPLERGLVYIADVKMGDVLKDGRKIVEILSTGRGKHGHGKAQLRFSDNTFAIFSFR